MRSLTARFALLAALVAPAGLAAQGTAPAPAPELKVGDMAPDFTLAASTKAGVSARPVKLSDYRGKTVVLAFFPRARTGGCTIQMTHYRDAYKEIFDEGRAATLFAISNDSARVTASWAADSAFPFTFLADVNDDAAKAYGAAGTARAGRQAADRRVAFVVGPDGRIAKVMNPFREIDATAYTELAAAIKDANKGKQ